MLCCHFPFFHSFSFKINIVKNIIKKLPILRQILKVLLTTFDYTTTFYDDEIFDSKMAVCLLHILKCM